MTPDDEADRRAEMVSASISAGTILSCVVIMMSHTIESSSSLCRVWLAGTHTTRVTRLVIIPPPPSIGGDDGV